MRSLLRNQAVCPTIILLLLTFTDPIHSQSTPTYACSNPASFRFCDTTLDVQARVQDLVARLNLDEKVGFLVSGSPGVARLGIPRYEWWSEALHGVSNVGPGTKFSSLVPGATSFPQVITTAASFNPTLFESIGKVVSTEARAMHNVGLAGLTFWSPNVNIFRDPRWGRGQETPGEDPLLASKYATSYVRGLQQTDDSKSNKLKVAACCKHYTAYDLEKWHNVDRFHFNAIVTQQDLDDTYQPPFKSCVLDGNVASVMCSYNQVNGKPTCADPDLLAGVVRGKWNLNGYIVSDCDSVQVLYESQHYTKTPEEAAARSILSGLDLNCGSYLRDHTPAAVKAGMLKETDVDKAISNNLATLMRLGFFDGNPASLPYGNLGPADVCTPSHQDLARDAARQGIVLLKNTAHTLPLTADKFKTIAVIGPNANVTKTMIGNYEGIPCKYVTPLQGLSLYTSTTYLPGCANVACTTADVAAATKLASAADATVLVMGIDQSIEAEDRDRTDVLLPGQQQLLITSVANAAKGPVILVIMSGGGFDISFAKNSDKVPAILWAGYPGEAGGVAIADVLFGAYNPSGRLPMTWYPQSYVDKVPMTDMNMRPNPAKNYPGRTYRFYTGQSVYKFGDGLSYSQFVHRIARAPPTQLTIPLADDHPCHPRSLLASPATTNCQSVDVVTVTDDDGASSLMSFDIHLNVKNTGGMSGGHTVMLFYTPPPGVHGAPRKHLLGFQKVTLGSQEEALVKFQLDGWKDLSVVDEAGNRKLPLGLHQLQIGDLNHLLHIRT